MKQKIQLTIPEPCHEDWKNMTATQQGRFCMSCQKQVIDFSVMTDNEILQYISTAGSSVCGRAGQDQLNRDLTMPGAPRKRWWKYWMGIAASCILVASRSDAQTGKIKAPVVPAPVGIKKIPVAIRMGTVANMQYNQDKTVICGRVTDENNHPVPYASIRIKGNQGGVAADAAGNFTLPVNTDFEDFTLVISSVGYAVKTTELQVESIETGTAKKGEIIKIAVKDIVLKAFSLEPVIVTGKGISDCGRTVGAVSIGIRVTRAEKLKQAFKEIAGINEIKIYPNPVSPGNRFNINFNFKEPGEYAVQFIDASGKIISRRQINIPSKNYTAGFSGDKFMAHGIYFVHVAGKQNGSNYAAKLLVQ